MSQRISGVIESKARALFVAGLILFSLLHLYGSSYPPNGYHQWRESDTAAVILNYFQEDHSFTEPRMNQRGDGSGITGMELPLYQYTAVLLYFISGPSHVVCRVLTMVGALVAATSLFALVRRLMDELTAATSAWALLFSPLFLFYSSKIMPDMWMLCFLIIAVDMYMRYLRNNSTAFWIVSLVCLICSAGIKPLGLCVYLPLLVITWRQRRSWRDLGQLAAYVVISFGATLCWFMHARSVSEANTAGAFNLGYNISQSWQRVAHPDFVKHLVLQWPWELWIGWVLVPLCLIGLFRAFRNPQFRLFNWWLAGAALVFIALAALASTHDYYTLIILPPLAVLTGFGASHLLTRLSWMRCTALVLLLLAPVAASARVAHRITAVPEFETIRREADLHVPRSSLVAVEDATTAIRLYQLNRHGWPIRFGVTYNKLKEAIDRGAKFVILENDRSTYADSVRMLIDTSGVAIGPLKAYRPALQAPAGSPPF